MLCNPLTPLYEKYLVSLGLSHTHATISFDKKLKGVAKCR